MAKDSLLLQFLFQGDRKPSSGTRNWSLVPNTPPSWNSGTFPPPLKSNPYSALTWGVRRVPFNWSTCWRPNSQISQPTMVIPNGGRGGHCMPGSVATTLRHTVSHGAAVLTATSPTRRPTEALRGHRALADLELHFRSVWPNTLNYHPTLLSTVFPWK